MGGCYGSGYLLKPAMTAGVMGGCYGWLLWAGVPAEASDDGGCDACVGPAGHHHVGVAQAHEAEGVADGVGAGRAGRRHRMVRALEAWMGREVNGGGMEEREERAARAARAARAGGPGGPRGSREREGEQDARMDEPCNPMGGCCGWLLWVVAMGGCYEWMSQPCMSRSAHVCDE